MSEKKYKFAEGADPFKSIERTSPAAFAVMIENGYIEEVEPEEDWFKCLDIIEVDDERCVIITKGTLIQLMTISGVCFVHSHSCEFVNSAISGLDVKVLVLKNLKTTKFKKIGSAKIVKKP